MPVESVTVAMISVTVMAGEMMPAVTPTVMAVMTFAVAAKAVVGKPFVAVSAAMAIVTEAAVMPVEAMPTVFVVTVVGRKAMMPVAVIAPAVMTMMTFAVSTNAVSTKAGAAEAVMAVVGKTFVAVSAVMTVVTKAAVVAVETVLAMMAVVATLAVTGMAVAGKAFAPMRTAAEITGPAIAARTIFMRPAWAIARRSGTKTDFVTSPVGAVVRSAAITGEALFAAIISEAIFAAGTILGRFALFFRLRALGLVFIFVFIFGVVVFWLVGLGLVPLARLDGGPFFFFLPTGGFSGLTRLD
jgi:hypothetical protein